MRELRELNGLLSENHDMVKPSMNEIYGKRMVLADGPLVPRTTAKKYGMTNSRITGEFEIKAHGPLKLSATAETPHHTNKKLR